MRETTHSDVTHSDRGSNNRLQPPEPIITQQQVEPPVAAGRSHPPAGSTTIYVGTKESIPTDRMKQSTGVLRTRWNPPFDTNHQQPAMRTSEAEAAHGHHAPPFMLVPRTEAHQPILSHQKPSGDIWRHLDSHWLRISVTHRTGHQSA